jgi:hypothetical protein
MRFVRRLENMTSLEFATRAARFGAVTFGIWTLEFLYSTYKFWLTKYATVAQANLPIVAVFQIIVAAVLAYLTWRTYRRPTLLLCMTGLVLATGDFAWTASSRGTFPLSVIWEIGFSLVGLNGVRTLQRLEAKSPQA